jgi:hypothetical protein
MKAEELRYNNIVKVKPQLLNGLSQEIGESIKDDAFRVLMIDKFFVNLQVNGGEWEFCLQDIEPIPLTEEILLKCGLKPEVKFKEIWLKYNSKKDDWRVYYNSTMIKRVKFLHELQNTIWLLTDYELSLQ